jgi:NADPH:quinone reductase-like Zn-dependent oxidoreductase
MSTPMMQAVVAHEYGTPDVLHLQEILIPTPSANEVLVRVHAAGVLPVDVAWLEGFFRTSRPAVFPFVPGSAYSGEVVQVGANVNGIQEGQAVFGRTSNGAFAEFTTIPIGGIPQQPYILNAAIPKPDAITFEQGATISGGANTAWRVLFDAAKVEAGQRVLIQGAAGGVGAFAVQLARWKGAEVIGTTSTANVEFVRSLGAETVIDYTTTRFEEVVEAVDVVIDTVGGEVLNRSFGVVKRNGKILSIVEEPNQALAETHGVYAPFFNTPPSLEQFIAIFQTIAGLITEGKITVPPPRLFPLRDVRQAYELCQTGHGRGRIVLQLS